MTRYFNRFVWNSRNLISTQAPAALSKALGFVPYYQRHPLGTQKIDDGAQGPSDARAVRQPSRNVHTLLANTMFYDHLMETLNVSVFLSLPVLTMALLVMFSSVPAEGTIPAVEEEPEAADAHRG